MAFSHPISREKPPQAGFRAPAPGDKKFNKRLVRRWKVSGREPDSDLEVLVAEGLRREGFDVAFQVGVSGYFIDLAVCDAADPDSYILGVECDGATYHSAKSVRDRDKLRQEILEKLGWRIYRIWSTDWFADPDGQMRKLVRHVNSLAR